MLTRIDHTKLIIVRGAGDIATGAISALWQAGFPVMALEIPTPSAIRRKVALSDAVWAGETEVEGIRGRLCANTEEAWQALSEEILPVLVDPDGDAIRTEHPVVVVDAILAKKNLGTTHDMAPVTIALGPGFVAGPKTADESACDAGNACDVGNDYAGGNISDVDMVIETKRGHNLGRIIFEGSAIPNTGIPGIIAGHGADRVIHSPAEGIMHNIREIGDLVRKDEILAVIQGADGTETEVRASLTGVLRGIIRDGYPVTVGFKVADIDPRAEEQKNCFTISDKARCIGGSVLTAVMLGLRRMEADKT